MRRNIVLTAIFLCALACTAYGRQSESSPISGPILGYVLDDSKNVRPILGIPGAATVGEPVELGFRLSDGVISSNHRYMIGTAQESGEIVVSKLGGSSPRPRGVPETIGFPDAIAISPDSSSAVLYYERRRAVQMLAGLPDNPHVAGDFDAGTATGILRALAVSDPGMKTAVALAFSEERSDDRATTLYIVDPDNGLRRLSTMPALPAIAFRPRTLDLMALDSSKHEVVLFRDVLGSGAPEPIAGAEQGIGNPIALAISPDGKRAFVANGGSSEIIILDLVQAVASVASCPCTPVQVQPLATNAVFRLTQKIDKTIWLLDGHADPVRFIFVPPYMR